MMTDEQMQQAKQHVSRYWGKKSCPCCGVLSWSVQDRIVICHNVTQDMGVDLGQGTPLMVVRCNNCSYSLFFNAHTIGLV